MSHPYITKRTEISGFFGMLSLFAGLGATSSHPIIVRIRSQFLHSPDSAALHVAAVILFVLAGLLIAFAIYSQVRFGGAISSVQPLPLFPPSGARAWFGVIMFVVVASLIGVFMLLHLSRS